MDFIESAISSIDVSESTVAVGPVFAEALRSKLLGFSFNSPTTTLVFFPTILDPSVGSMPDKISYKRQEPAVFLKMNIPHGEWRGADRSTRVRLYAKALARGIEGIRESKISASERSSLLAIVRDVERDLTHVDEPSS